MVKRKILRFGGVGTVLAGALLVLSAFISGPVLAAQTGDVWVQPAGSQLDTSLKNTVPHIPGGGVDVYGIGLTGGGAWKLVKGEPLSENAAAFKSGSYSYSGSNAALLFTLTGLTPDHYKIIVDQSPDGNGATKKSKVFWIQATPAIRTETAATATVGTALSDVAVLSGGTSPTGTITFKLYPPSQATCTGTPFYSFTNSEVSGNGTYAGATSPATNAVGVWRWVASYSGDDLNSGASTGCDEEQVAVGKATPAIRTTPSAGGVVGATITDTATLSGGYSTLGGAITFKLYDPSDHLAFTSGAVPVDGAGTYSMESGYKTELAGTWHWVAEYSGDGFNNAVASPKADEPVTITEPAGPNKATPVITTTTNPSSGTVGTALNDTAHLTGGSAPKGTITFTLYKPDDTVAYQEYVTVNGPGDYSTVHGFTSNAVGTWHWVAEYSGDDNNNGVASVKAEEPVTITAPEQPNKVTPAITTTTHPSSGTVGVALNDTAHLTGGSAPKGTIIFTLYKPDDTVAYQETVTINGPGDYSTVHGFTSNAVGTWHWAAGYSGDANNNPVASAKADEPVTITAAATNDPAPTPTGAVLGETLAATGSANWPFDIGILLVALGTIAVAIGFGVIRVRRWES